MSTLIQRSLSGGELDPALWPRSDVTKYMTGLRCLRNAVVRRNGGALARPPTLKISPIKDSTKVTRLIPFIFNIGQAYVLEFGDYYIRFYQNGALLTAQGATAWSSATTYHPGDLVTSGGVTYFCCVTTGTVTYNGQRFGNNGTLYGSSHGSLNQAPSTHPLSWYPLASTIYEIPSPYTVADLAQIRYDQTANDITLTHLSYPPFRLTRSLSGSHYAFVMYVIQSGSYMAPTSPSASTSGSNTYAVVPVSLFGDEYAQINGSLSIVSTAGSTPTLTWAAVSGAVSYNVYFMNANGVFGFIGSTATTSFLDSGITPDYANAWVQDQGQIFFSVNTNPTCCAYYQQRLFYANSNNLPTRTWGSQTGLYDNFNINVPAVDTDSFNFQMAGNQDAVQHLVNIGTLIVFTYGTENSILGDSSGAISPSAINPHRESVHGSSSLKPLIVGEFAVYNQAQGSVVRDLGFNFQVDGYRGDDLTIFATHLFDNYTLLDWTYQVTPNSIIWAVRSDGTLLSMTYVREQQILAWAHHDTTAGVFENVCCIPEGNQSAVYMIVNRTINGSSVRFVERMYAQDFTNIVDFIGMDCATTYDGRNSTINSPPPFTITGGTNWDETELLTASSASSSFTVNNVGNQIFFTGADGSFLRFTIQNYIDSANVTGMVDRTVPVSMRAVAISIWAIATNTITGLGYLEGQAVSVLGDGNVVGSPNNSAYPVYTVSSGSITLDKPYAVIHVGLPITTDIETLDIDNPTAMDTMSNKMKVVGEVTLHMVKSRSVFVGGANPDKDPTNLNNDPLYRLTEQKLRQNEPYDSPINLVTGKVTQNIQGEWDSNGHVFIRSVDPVPLLIAAIAPEGLYPMKGA